MIVIKQKVTKCIIIFSILTFISCGGGKMIIDAPNVKKVVSTTEVIFDQNYKHLNSLDYEVVGNFSFNVHKWTIFWTLIPLSSDVDMSEQLNAQLDKYNGDAIVNLSIETGSMIGGSAILNSISSIFPLIPSVVVAKVKGDVVRVKK